MKNELFASMLIIISLLVMAGAAGACGMDDAWKRPVPGEPIVWQGGNVSGVQALEVFNLSLDFGGQSGINRNREYVPVNATALEAYMENTYLNDINIRARFPGSLVGTSEYLNTLLVEKDGVLGFAIIRPGRIEEVILGIDCCTGTNNGIQFS